MEKIMNVKNYFLSAWNVVMDETKNPFRRLPVTVGHMLMQILAWMWSAIFSVAIGSYVVFGVTAVGHSLFVAGIFATFLVFREAIIRSEPKARP
jgi:hypothetical protein